MQNTKHFNIHGNIPIHWITVVWTGQPFIELLPAIELLTDSFIFMGSKGHVMMSSRFSDLTKVSRKSFISQWNKKTLKNPKVHKKTAICILAYRTTEVLFASRKDLPLSACMRLRATDLSSGQTKLPLSSIAVNNCKLSNILFYYQINLSYNNRQFLFMYAFIVGENLLQLYLTSVDFSRFIFHL